MSGSTSIQMLDPTPIPDMPDVSILVLEKDSPTNTTFYPLGNMAHPLYSVKSDDSANNTEIRHERNGTEMASIHRKKMGADMMTLRGGELMKVKDWLVNTKEPVHGVSFTVRGETYTWGIDSGSRLTLYCVHSITRPVAWYTPSDRHLRVTHGPPSITRAYLALTPQAEQFWDEIIISFCIVFQKVRSGGRTPSTQWYNAWGMMNLMSLFQMSN
ncbi:hypothetical protein JAAARDRAFT_636586 [Jaapia argillacea MUCL 33604]|uniref:DUF6593 domain-containing protein n=1 Tax=Jaapia argillacea MUCL 33604 TaxID=933084 RepID=A0A067PZ06_9AGAM|nr:hypothetical protein JAAARDRAFT_636586 [Jaapia argillacea MUCL 33604]